MGQIIGNIPIYFFMESKLLKCKDLVDLLCKFHIGQSVMIYKSYLLGEKECMC